MRFDLDNSGATTCDLDVLIDTRTLIQANSGGGKSWKLRRVLEQTHGKVQQLVLDPEGEFASLREKYDYVHAAAKGGDTPAQPRSAALLAERLLELGVSAVLDLYELKAHERIRFVRLFLEAMIEAPKRLWHPVLVVVDEAHTFCPQKGDAESASAVIDLCARGRKRGFSALLATQRIAKLHKDAAAELNNKFIGRTTLDIDLARAADELGFSKLRWPELRQLSPGEFFAVGPALNKRGVVAVTVGKVRTTHPKAGARIAFAGAPPTAKIRALLPKLSDLPAEAEERAKTVEELRLEVTKLKRELASKPIVKAEPKVVEKIVERVPKDLHKLIIGASKDVGDLLKRTQKLVGEMTDLAELRGWKQSDQPKSLWSMKPSTSTIPAQKTRERRVVERKGGGDSSDLPVGERRLLVAIAQQETDGAAREQLAVLTGYAKSTRNTYIQRLTNLGFIETRGSRFFATDAGVEALGSDFEPLPEGEELRAHWLRELPEGEGKLLGLLIAGHPESVQRQTLCDQTGYAKSSCNTYLQRLAARQIITTERGGSVRASDRLF